MTNKDRVKELLVSVEEFMDAANGRLGSKEEFCIFCHSNTADGSGIIHTQYCPVKRLRQAIREAQPASDQPTTEDKPFDDVQGKPEILREEELRKVIAAVAKKTWFKTDSDYSGVWFEVADEILKVIQAYYTAQLAKQADELYKACAEGHVIAREFHQQELAKQKVECNRFIKRIEAENIREIKEAKELVAREIQDWLRTHWKDVDAETATYWRKDLDDYFLTRFLKGESK